MCHKILYIHFLWCALASGDTFKSGIGWDQPKPNHARLLSGPLTPPQPRYTPPGVNYIVAHHLACMQCLAYCRSQCSPGCDGFKELCCDNHRISYTTLTSVWHWLSSVRAALCLLALRILWTTVLRCVGGVRCNVCCRSECSPGVIPWVAPTSAWHP